MNADLKNMDKDKLDSLMEEAFKAKPGGSDLVGGLPHQCVCGAFWIWPLGELVVKCGECKRIWKRTRHPLEEWAEKRAGEFDR